MHQIPWVITLIKENLGVPKFPLNRLIHYYQVMGCLGLSG